MAKIRLDQKAISWICNVGPQAGIFGEDFRTRLKLKSIREILQDRRLYWFGHLKVEGIEESTWLSKCRTFKVGSSFPRR